MAKKTDIQLAKATAYKRIKSAVRLEMSIRADAVLNDLLDEFDKAFQRQLASGGPVELTAFDSWVKDAVEERAPLSLVRGERA